VVLVVRLTMGMLVPSLSLRLGIGVWMSAIVVGVVVVFGLVVARFGMYRDACDRSRL
jgi:hypothetical protein